MKESFFATRHARPARDKSDSDPVSETYPDLTQEGVIQAQEKARGEIMDLINNSPEGSVVFIGATSDQPRTKQTAEIYGDALAEYQDDTADDNLVVLTKSRIEEMSGPNGERSISETVKSIQRIITENPDKKIVIDFPLMIKQLAYKYNDRWTDADGKKTEYFSEILKKHGGDHAAAGKDWIANQGKLVMEDGRVIEGPKPENVAKEYLEGIQRVKDFVMKYVEDRHVVIGEVGHQWDIDALVTYLGSNRVDQESFETITGGDIAGEAEMTSFEIGNDMAKVHYRGKDFEIQLSEE
ncbi:MAG: hypothetical protein WCW66_02865 [Patescibacteria group bacterium]|jgi:phosphohistidine phosphatase SixA